MLSGAVAKRYADALFSLASEQDKVLVVEKELSLVVTMLETHPEWKQIIMHPSIAVETKKEQIQQFFGDSVQPIVLNFVKILVDGRRQEYLQEIYKQFVHLADEANGRVQAHLETAVALSDEELEVVRAQVSQSCGLKLEMKTSVNPDLIGGAMLRIGDRLIDASVKGKLDRFRQQLTTAR